MQSEFNIMGAIDLNKKYAELPEHLQQNVLDYIEFLLSRENKPDESSPEKQVSTGIKAKKKGISHLAGSWKHWEDQEFKDFLQLTNQVRENLFAPRNIQMF